MTPPTTPDQSLTAALNHGFDSIRGAFKQALAEAKDLRSRLDAEIVRSETAEATEATYRGRTLLAEKSLEESQRRCAALGMKVGELERALEEANATINYTAADVNAAKRRLRVNCIAAVQDHLRGWRFGFVDLGAIGRDVVQSIEGKE